MAIGYRQDFDNAGDGLFREKVTIAILNAAVAIMAEANGTTGHVLRTTLANKVLLNPASYVAQFAQAAVCDDTTDPATITDANLQNRINSLWNAFANVIL